MYNYAGKQTTMLETRDVAVQCALVEAPPLSLNTPLSREDKEANLLYESSETEAETEIDEDYCDTHD